ncbi:FAD-dependent monooxygenase [Streptomyces sp. SID3343]|uniref:FAD-dependent oxidoreductase n=1 Tax=Streptomyces sp. SID3343 TaxID=2690260 RepID=UPI00136D05C8|nr:FAD-dependent monooxygenase [Streptomyces sp. SID3343]MYW02540.1 monooxygenase [Streptomyces sp. SID3343]
MSPDNPDSPDSSDSCDGHDGSEADERVPVLIVGGSLVGLATSVFLGRLGVRHVVVERHSGTSRHPRGRGNNVRTMELFRTAGVEDRIRAAAAVLADNHGILQADTIAGGQQEWLFKEIDPGGGLSRVSSSSWCLCSQNDLEPVLVDYARELGGDLRFGTELVAFRQDSDGVTAHLEVRESGERRVVRADYVVAADGPRSPVRERLGIAMSGRGDLFHNVSITFTAPDLAAHVGERRFIVCYLTNPAGDGALLPVDNRERWVFHAPWHPERGEGIESFTDERCVAHIRAAMGVPDLEVKITGKAPWHAAERVAERYRDGRVFLAGDSAHEMSPTGAFGSNTGIQDAHNLAWKLAAVLGRHAGAGLLDTYEAERRPVALATSARASTRSAEHSHPGYAAPTTDAGPKQPGVLGVVLGYRYASAAVVGVDPELPVLPERFCPPCGEPGSRAPHLVVLHEGVRRSVLDLYEDAFVLLVGTGVDGDAWRRAARVAAERLDVRVSTYRIGAKSTPEDVELVTEPEVSWADTHGVTEGGAVLIRPDGFVAWRASAAAADPERTLTDVLAAVSCRVGTVARS